MDTPRRILIIGSGAFGLSTAHALSTNPQYASSEITVVDRSTFPSTDAASIDVSRIVRSDYSDPAYAGLALQAQEAWRNGAIGRAGRYNESGLLLVAVAGQEGEGNVRRSYQNAKALLERSGDEEGIAGMKVLTSKEAIAEAAGTGGANADFGYFNPRGGWADAEQAMRFLRKQVEQLGRVQFRVGEVTELLRDDTGSKLKGVKLTDGQTIDADLVVLAAGAWSGRLVDLRGRINATGQSLCYIELTEEEQEYYGKLPVFLTRLGCYIIPPRNRLLKIARHDYGYFNPVSVPLPQGPEDTMTVSLPRTTHDDAEMRVPKEGQDSCRRVLSEMIPALATRPFVKTRVCWYSDSQDSHFLITYHPELENLFVATGDSGHGFKFLPVIGTKIMECIQRKCPEEFKEKWAWPKEAMENVMPEKDTRRGAYGLILSEELQK